MNTNTKFYAVKLKSDTRGLLELPEMVEYLSEHNESLKSLLVKNGWIRLEVVSTTSTNVLINEYPDAILESTHFNIGA